MMKNSSKLKELKTLLQIIIPIWFVFFVFVFSIIFIFIPSLKNNLINQKEETIQKLTDSAVSLLSEYNQRVLSGELILEEAKSRAANRIRNLKYGPKGKDYFWITDMHPFMIMHPYRPDLETSDVTLFRDLEGNYPFMAMVEMVLKNKGGYVNYFWQSKDAPQKVVPKISYVKGFEPWGWIVGTGIYIEDVNFEIKGALDGLKTIFICILLLVLCLSVYITWQTIRSRNKKRLMEEAFRKEKETLSMILERTPHGISLVDNDGKYLYLNPYYTKITGYILEDIPSKEDWFKKAYPDENYRKEIIEAWNKDILEGELGKIREFKIKCKNGDTKHIEFRSAFLKDKKISVLTDITSRKESEEIVREKDRLQGVLELSGAVCHEMSQPLMSALGYFDLIMLDMPVDDPNYSRICKIQTQLERMSDITKKLMKISRYQTKDYLDGKIYDLAGTSKTEISNR
ncbi:cache domain-containing protein [Desulfobacula sp.]|uniref:cache domain-containing protein n=1 Tax=Desulfobacula sp. TaxID=2593537 RepID=UPI00262288A5|nr:cache domain-containing protein [Desulfobacula sp.]